MRRGVLFGVSVGLHALVWGAGTMLVHVGSDTRRGVDPTLVSFVLVPAQTESAEIAEGKRRDGVEPTRPTGAPDARARGRAGDHGLDASPGPHRRGADARDRSLARDDAAALASALGVLAAAADEIGARGIPSAEEALGARDDARDGARPGDSFVSPGTRGLDMHGTGRGSGSASDEIGTSGRGVLGPGALAAAEPRAHAWGLPRTRRRDLCVVMHQGCPVRTPRLVISVELVSGPADLAIARRVIARYRTALGRCAGRSPLDLAVAVTAEGALVTTEPCVGAALASARLPVATEPSRLRLVLGWSRR